MNETTKESKFLDAIKKYAEQQKALIGAQVEEYKSQKIEQATEAGLQDAYDLIQRDIAERKAAIVSEYAQKEYDLKKQLFAERQAIVDEVFRSASDRLLAYTETQDYRDAYLRELKEAAALCDGSACVITASARDASLAESAKSLFTQAQIQTTDAISLGGFQVLCEDKGILIDATLDTKLSRERDSFTDYSGLKVV